MSVLSNTDRYVGPKVVFLIKEAKFVISNSGGKLLRHVKMFIVKRITMKNHLEDEIYFRCNNTTSFLLKIKFSQGEGQDYRQLEDAVDARMLHLKYMRISLNFLSTFLLSPL